MEFFSSFVDSILTVYEYVFYLLQSVFHSLLDLFVGVDYQVYCMKAALLRYLHQLGQSSPELIMGLRFLKNCLVVYGRVIYLCFLMRLVLFWLPSINPYIPPFFILVVITKPSLDFFTRILPRVFGMDFSFLVVTSILVFLIQTLDNFRF
jgi:uncharacterized protein YggT (Ycf19 family)